MELKTRTLQIQIQSDLDLVYELKKYGSSFLKKKGKSF